MKIAFDNKKTIVSILVILTNFIKEIINKLYNLGLAIILIITALRNYPEI
jgi:hypothetical protein